MKATSFVLGLLFAASTQIDTAGAIRMTAAPATESCGPTPTCGCNNCGGGSGDGKAASAARKAERSVKSALKKLEDK